MCGCRVSHSPWAQPGSEPAVAGRSHCVCARRCVAAHRKHLDRYCSVHQQCNPMVLKSCEALNTLTWFEKQPLHRAPASREAKPSPGRTAARVWALLAIKTQHKNRPRDPSGRPRKFYLVYFRGSTIDGHGVICKCNPVAEVNELLVSMCGSDANA